MFKKFSILLLCLSTAINLQAREDWLNLSVEARSDFQKMYVGNENIASDSGFKGNLLNLRINGSLGEHFSYTIRHRLNQPMSSSSAFDATDFLLLSYDSEKWRISAGKTAFMVGGYEYDLAPIDFYFCSEFSFNIPCYQFGVSATRKSGNNEFTFQVSNSPFRSISKDNYGFNFFWSGKYEHFESLYSVNFVEYGTGKLLNYISLGNKFKFGDFTAMLDLMNRSSMSSFSFGKDFTGILKLCYSPDQTINIFTKCSYDINATNEDFDLCVLPGTELLKIGGGVEIWPFKSLGKNLRIHAVAHHGRGTNTNPYGGIIPGEFYLNLGVTWRIRII